MVPAHVDAIYLYKKIWESRLKSVCGHNILKDSIELPQYLNSSRVKMWVKICSRDSVLISSELHLFVSLSCKCIRLYNDADGVMFSSANWILCYFSSPHQRMECHNKAFMNE